MCASSAKTALMEFRRHAGSLSSVKLVGGPLKLVNAAGESHSQAINLKGLPKTLSYHVRTYASTLGHLLALQHGLDFKATKAGDKLFVSFID